MNKNQHKRSAFSGKIGFVLSAAGASVGLGNIWRFPYLAAKYGGGIFLLIYIILAFTFGYTMIVAETALGRMTKKSPVGAFAAVRKGGRSFGGWINAIIPILIVPYYSVIGGWVIRYLADYISGHGSELAADGYFSAFISSGASAEICFVIFTIFTLAIIFAGVRNGVERVSKVMMPILVVLSLVIGVTGWAGIAKVVRTEVRRLRTSEYVLAARCMGGGFFHVLWEHLAPNFLSAILFMVVMNVQSAILAESTLSFLGLGLPLEVISWGSMLSLAQQALLTKSWWAVVIPGIFLVATLLSVTLLGNALRYRNSHNRGKI